MIYEKMSEAELRAKIVVLTMKADDMEDLKTANIHSWPPKKIRSCQLEISSMRRVIGEIKAVLRHRGHPYETAK